MAVITATGNGNNDSTTVNAPWPGGTLPDATSDVVIPTGKTVTWHAAFPFKTLTINSGGTLNVDTSVGNLTMTAERDIVVDGTWNLDVSAVPNNTYRIYTNNANSSGTGTISAAGAASPAHNAGGLILFRNTAVHTIKGATKSRWTTLVSGISVGATAATVASATGWKVGDRIILATTDAYASTPHTDMITIATVNTGTGAITWVGGTTYAHAADGLVGNFTSNLIIGPATAGWSGAIGWDNASTTSAAKTFDHVQLESCKSSSYFGTNGAFDGGVNFTSGGAAVDTGWQSFNGNIVYDTYGNFGVKLINSNVDFERKNTVYYSANMNDAGSQEYTSCGTIVGVASTYGNLLGTETDCVIFRGSSGYSAEGTSGTMIRPKISGCNHSGIFARKVYDLTVVDPDIQSNLTCLAGFNATVNVSGTTATSAKMGTTVACTNLFKLGPKESLNITLTDVNIQSGGTFALNSTLSPADSNKISLVNKNAVVTAQEIYRPYGTIKRSNQICQTSPSSLAFRPTTAATNLSYTASVACANGGSIRLLGGCKIDKLFYNGGTWTAPTITISGLGITPQVFTAAGTGVVTVSSVDTGTDEMTTSAAHGLSVGQKVCVDATTTLMGGLTASSEDAKVSVEMYVVSTSASDKLKLSTTYGGSPVNLTSAGTGTQYILKWESVDLSATNSSGADGNFTITFTANAASSSNFGTVWFDGIPTATPFVTKARHYAYQFDQTSPNAVASLSTSASEATANAYSGVAVSGGTSTSSTTISASKTFQQVFDHTQAWSCRTENMAYAVPLTAPVAGVLIAGGDVTINTGYSVSGSGSLAMGSYSLTTETASAQSYTYTGGTWSQSTTVPSVSGGTLALSGEGTWTLTATGSPVITFAPTANAVTYAMGGSTFGGTLDLRNTHATRTITVELPSGTTYTTANNTGGAITVSTPQVYQSVTVSGATAGSRIQIYDTTSSTELYNGTPTFPYTWTDGTPASASRAIRLRVAYQSGATAKTFIDQNIGTCATSGAGKDVSYLVSQTADTSYNTNAIDGSTVTGIVIDTAGGDRVKINLAGGAVTWASIYAYQVYWQATSTGIAQEAAFIEAPDTANYLLTDFDLKNTHATIPLTVTGGWGRDAVTGLSKDIIDTTGTNIYLAPDHVIPYSTGSGLTAGQAADLTAAAASASSAATLAAAIPTNPLLTNDSRITTLVTKLTEVHQMDGLDSGNPVTVDASSRSSGTIAQSIAGTSTVVLTRTA